MMCFVWVYILYVCDVSVVCSVIKIKAIYNLSQLNGNWIKSCEIYLAVGKLKMINDFNCKPSNSPI